MWAKKLAGPTLSEVPVNQGLSHNFKWVSHTDKWDSNMPTAILDERGRVVLPRELADELGVSKGDMVVFERKGKDFVVMRASSKKERLEEVMDWNPERTGKPEVTAPKDMKGIWKT